MTNANFTMNESHHLSRQIKTVLLLLLTLFSVLPSNNNNIIVASYPLRALILRHGQSNGNAQDVIQGSSDRYQLTPKGKAQAKEVALFLKEEQQKEQENQQNRPPPVVYCSPLQRVRQTHQILRDEGAVPQEVTLLPDLREIDFYDWQDRGKTELQQAFPDSWKAWKAGDPYGLVVQESTSIVQDGKPVMTTRQHQPLLELWERADRVWDDIIASSASQRIDSHGKHVGADDDDVASSVLIAAHGSLGQALLGSAMGWDATHFRQHTFSNCGLVEIEWDTITPTMDSSTSQKRPLASRWRWKWPVPSSGDDWNTYTATSDDVVKTEEEISAEL